MGRRMAWVEGAIARHSTVALLLAAVAAANEGGTPLLANKCCPLSAQLDKSLTSCVPYDSAPATSNTTQETAGEIRRRGESRFPWWIYPNTTVYDAETFNELSNGAFSFLGNASENALLRYGNRPCAYNGTQLIFSTSQTKYKLLANGSIMFSVWKTNGSNDSHLPIQITLPPEKWCSDRVATGKFALLLCPCERVTCVNRCCSKATMFVAEKQRKIVRGVCTAVANASERLVHPRFFAGRRPLGAWNASDADVQDEGAGEDEAVVYTELVTHSPACDKTTHAKYLLNSNPEIDPLGFWIQRNGSVLIEDYGHGQPFEPSQFCLTRVLKRDDSIVADVAFCHMRSTHEAPSEENIYYSLLFLSGAFFLLLTLLVHALVPELRRSAHSKALMCHCATLFVASVTLTVGHLQRRFLEPFCSMSAFIVQFFFLSTFFWLNVMCFDLSWTFGAMRQRIPSSGGQGRRFLYYSLYAWGCPALITAITLFMEYASVVPQDLPLLPNIGARRCWFDTKAATFAYYYGPMTLLLVANLVLFAFTVGRIRSAQRGTSILRRGSASARNAGGAQAAVGVGVDAASGEQTPAAEGARKRAAARGERQMLMVFTKLFCLMGVTWVTEIISWLTSEESSAFWYITDAINLLRGVLIFVLFCCKPTTLRPLRARLRDCASRCCPWALRWLARAGPSVSGSKGASSSTLESSLSLAEMHAGPKRTTQQAQTTTQAQATATETAQL